MKSERNIKQGTDSNLIGKIVTFYSFKGGSGRSMSLANLAVLFSKQSGGKKVLMIDWDLEAPGLHEFFKGKINETDLREKQGVIELFELAKQKLPDNFSDDLVSRKKAISLIEKYFDKNLIRLQTSEHLELLQAGKPDPEYAASVQKFDWRDFFDTRYDFFSALVEFFKSRWDYILIDSRTGLTDTGGICTAILPEALVTVFTPTRQGLKVTEMIERALSFRKGAGDMRPLVVYPLVSRVDASEEDRNREWKEIYTPLFQDQFKRLYGLPKCDLKRYFGKVEIHYVRKYAYGEQVSVLEPYDLKNRFELPARYNELAQIIIGNYLPWEAPDLPDIPMTDANRVGYYAIELKNNGEFKRAETYYQKAIEMNPNHIHHLGNYALFLHETKKDYAGAEEYYRKSLELDPSDATNLANYANFLKEIKKDYKIAEEYYRKALKKAPDHANILGNYALFLKEIKKDYITAEKYYREALAMAPNHANILGNYALFLEEIKKDYITAEEYYRKALEIAPNHAIILGNYASLLYGIKKDYAGAEECYRKALEIAPNEANNLSNYAQLLFWTGRSKEAEEK
ncbi:MAG: tetratricopeptide repeat protein [Lewinellaceae bacterium]|nr:tetratricopeptide repeat protein [Lewinellaceae bacterium]